MDLFAYTQIDDLGEVAKANGIDVPRLRGLRLMKYEESVSAEEIEKAVKASQIEVAEDLCCSRPFWTYGSTCHEYSSRTDCIRDYYLVKGVDENGYSEYTDIRWDRIHGKKRKDLKFAIKKKARRIREQLNTFNKYAGKDGILYIHARIGGGNWSFYGGEELSKKSWFIEKVDDSYDRTYCDIYARITNHGV